MKFNRHPANPLLLPDPASTWETYNVFNTFVILHNGLFHMHYRAQGLDWVSRIGYAVSRDGLQWNRLREPVLSPEGDQEARGVEDPRVTEIDGTFYMTYTAYGLSQAAGFEITPMIARSRTSSTGSASARWCAAKTTRTICSSRASSTAASWPCIAARPRCGWPKATTCWPGPKSACAPSWPAADAAWDNKRVGGNGVPIETEAGWLMLYHAYDQQHVYKLGVCLLDRDDPGRVLHRPRDPIFEPEEIWELKGDVPNVVFSCANPVVNGQVYVYYGAADHVIALATCHPRRSAHLCPNRLSPPPLGLSKAGLLPTIRQNHPLALRGAASPSGGRAGKGANSSHPVPPGQTRRCRRLSFRQLDPTWTSLGKLVRPASPPAARPSSPAATATSPPAAPFEEGYPGDRQRHLHPRRLRRRPIVVTELANAPDWLPLEHLRPIGETLAAWTAGALLAYLAQRSTCTPACSPAAYAGATPLAKCSTCSSSASPSLPQSHLRPQALAYRARGFRPPSRCAPALDGQQG